MFSSTKDQLNQAKDDLSDGAQRLKNQAKATGYQVKNDLGASDNIVETLSDGAQRLGQRARSVFDNASDDISYAAKSVRQEIYDKPLQSSVIALCAGFLLGLLWRRN